MAESTDRSESQDQDGLVPCEKGRLLVVDDEKGIRLVFQQIVAYGLPDCRVDLAVNGAEAVEAFRAVHYSLVLMDLHMPVMDGETAFHKIQEICTTDGWEMPAVVFCTGYDPSPNLRQIVSNSDLHYLLRKPVANDVLVDVLRSRL